MNIFEQGVPDGSPRTGHPDPNYPVHRCDNSAETLRRDYLLGNKHARAVCGHGGYHMWMTKVDSEVTCSRCLEKLNGPK